MIALRRTASWVATAAVIPAGVAAAWIPLRGQLSNADLALVLVLVVGGVGAVKGARASVLAAVSAATAFDLLDTRPYGALTMSSGADVTTALILLLTGVLVGVGAARLTRYRASEHHRDDALAVVMEASGLVATGEEGRLVTAALAEEIRRSLQLEACTFWAEPPKGTRPSVRRDGTLVGLISGQPEIDLPVWSHGEVIAHYRLLVGQSAPSPDALRVALSLADQAGAAMSGVPYQPPPPPSGKGVLRPTEVA